MTGPEPFLLMYTIYHRPADLPGVEYLVREVEIYVGATAAVMGRNVAITDNLTAARAAIPARADACLPRHPTDDPVIVETWV